MAALFRRKKKLPSSHDVIKSLEDYLALPEGSEHNEARDELVRAQGGLCARAPMCLSHPSYLRLLARALARFRPRRHLKA